MKRYWAIVGGTFVVPMVEIAKQDIADLRERHPKVTSIPVYFCRGVGFWPTPRSDCVVVTEVDLENV
jgi:hypothetical protein